MWVARAIPIPTPCTIREFACLTPLARVDDLHAPLLVPQLPLPPPNGSELTPRARAVLVLEAEQDIRTLERQLREIDVLEKRGAASAGNLEGKDSQ